MGKRGPKPGSGGRPRKYTDEFHRIKRELTNDYNRRMRLECSSENIGVLELFKFGDKKS